MGYLVIARKIGERIFIGDEIEILISDISKQDRKVDVAIKAPKSFVIKRRTTQIEEQKLGEKSRSNN